MQIVFAFQPQEKKNRVRWSFSRAAYSWAPAFQLPSCPTPSRLPFSKPAPHQPTPSPSGKQTLQPRYFPTICDSAADEAGDCWLRFLASSCAGWLGEAWAWLDGHWLTVLLEDWDG